MPVRRKLLGCGRFISFLLIFALSGVGLSAAGRSPVNYPYPQIARQIKDQLASYINHPTAQTHNKKIFSLQTVEEFYRDRNYAPAWYGKRGFADAEVMLKEIRQSANDGLIPENYHLREIENLLGKTYTIRERDNSVDPAIPADLDLLLTDSFFTLASHLSSGCVNPATLEPEWSFSEDVDLSHVLANALQTYGIGETLRALAPGGADYAELREALARYREMARQDHQTPVARGRLLKKGMRSPRIPEIRKKLSFLGDFDRPSTMTDELFDADLQQAVTRFQARHGLKVDGIVGPATVEALDVPVDDRVKQLIVNLERLRWSDIERGDRYLIVNIARFELDVVDKGKVVLSMKVVVGKPYLNTPVFREKLTYLVINPVWNIPDSIAEKEVLPKIKKDPAYLKEENITVLRGWGDNEEEIDPRSIDWTSVTPGNLSFRFRQEPGPLNPLGRIKFMFPNRFNIYLHDTPARNLFLKDVRTFSHGCIRIEKPVELADDLLKGDPDWTKGDIMAAMESGETEEVRLPRPLYVYIVYVTAWVDKDGSAEFRKDIYGRDAAVYEAITQNPFGQEVNDRPYQPQAVGHRQMPQE